MASKIDGSANIRSIVTSRIPQSLLGSSVASRSMILILGKSTYRDDGASATPSISAAVAASEDSGTADAATSCPLAREDGTQSPSSTDHHHILTT
jgi:hypothetical protein